VNDWQELEHRYFLSTFKRLPVTLVRGRGVAVWDDAGKEYLDFVAGWAVNSLGHCHPVVVQALVEQANTLIHTSNQFYTVPQIRLAELLLQNSCFNKVFLSNSGTEANEGAVKLARKYGKLRLGGAFEVITTVDSFHGRTLAMVAATGQRKFQQPYVPMPSGFVNVEYDDIDAVQKATSSRTCAVMVEPIQGEGGVNVPAEDYLKRLRAWCDEKGILLILDEVQTGVGRTGALFAYQHFGIEPDIMTLAKGLGGGVPIGAILSRNKSAVFEPGDHGSTFGGNPEFDLIVDVRGRGLLQAIEFNREVADEAVAACLDRGLLVNRLKPNALRFMPPLIIEEQDVDRAMDILKEVLATL